MNMCNLKCFEFNICIYMFIHTYLNNKIQFNICRHIHVCCRLFEKFNEAPAAGKNEIYEIKELINYSNEIQASSPVTGIDLIQQKINLFQSLFK